MPKTTFAGHALHPQFVAGPLSLFPMALFFDFLHAVTRDDAHARAAFTTLAAGYANALAAAASGLGDYVEIKDADAKQTATTHLLLNIGVMALTGASLWRRMRSRSDGLAVALNAAGNGLMMISAWYGGELVYRHGVRVSGREEMAEASEVKVPGDAASAGVLENIGRLAPPPPESG
ncbi:MAG TPA: DUF2231 domain-containing protein [Dehalococcoidia bacterium]|nr:DUF2231 domain-containing protein [Dehalococcoidia bacterium]